MRKGLLDSSVIAAVNSHLEGTTPLVQLPRVHAQLELRLWILEHTQFHEFPG